MSKHKVRLHKWEDGVLKSLTHFFDSMDDAVTFASTADAHGAKIYSDTGELVYTVNPAVVQGPEHAYS